MNQTEIIKCTKCGGDAFRAFEGEGVVGTDRSTLSLEEMTHNCGAVICESCIVSSGQSLEDPATCPNCGSDWFQ